MATALENSSRGGFVQRKLVAPLMEQVKKGADPATLAKSVAAGVVVGLVPAPGLTAAVAAVVAMIFGCNMVAIQVVQLSLAPIQLFLIIPLMRTGEWLTGFPPTSLEDVTKFTSGDFTGSLGAVWAGFLCALVCWAAIAPFVFLVAWTVASPLLRKIMGEKATAAKLETNEDVLDKEA